MNPESKNSSSPAETRGHLLFLKRHCGSKSERFFPRLISDEGQGFWLKHKDDDSFNHATLREWHGRHVRVNGQSRPDGLLLIDEIFESVDPFLV